MELTTLRTYLAVCRLGSLSAAASDLGYTQSAVSRQVAALERQVGVQLLSRRARGVVPTAAGEAFRHHARMVVTEAERAVRAARDVDSAESQLAIGATPSTAAGLVPVALRRMQADRAGIVWTLVNGLTPELVTRVVDADLDVAVVTDAPPGLPADDRVTRHLLGVDPMCVIVPEGHPAAGSTEPRSLAEFADSTWVEDNEGSAALLRTAAARAAFEPRLDLIAADLVGKAAMVAAGHAVALVPGILRAALRRDVVAIPIADAPTRGIYAITSPRGPASTHPLALEVVRALGEAFPAA